MKLQEKLEKLEEIFDVDNGTLSPDMQLANIEEWDSLAALSFVVFMGDEFNKKLSGAQIRAFTTVQDILDTMKSDN